MENRISIPKGGLKKSIDPRNLSSNDITHALNTTLFDTDGDFYDISYEKSNILATQFPEGYVIIGRVNRLKNNFTYYFLTNPLTGNSLFGYVDNSANYDDSITENNLENDTQTPYKTFNILLDDSCTVDKLKLSELHPIQNIVLKEEKTGAVIYFTDFINPSRYIEIDNIQKYFTEEVPCDDDINIPCPDVSKMRIHKLYLLPKIDDVVVTSGGSLERGTYSFLIALSDAMGNEVSEYTSITQPISIWDNTNETTDKAIRLLVNDLDTDYTHYKVVVLFNQQLDNAQSTRLVGVFPNTNKEVIVSNIGNLERISYETITYVNVRVTNSENLTSFNNQLAEYGLVYERELNLQPVVNMMGSYLKWQTHVAREDLYSYPEMQYKYTGINRNEVVPYSLRFLKKGGSTTALFPLVGREANAIDLQEINNLDVESLETGISCGDNLRTQRWKLYNTATVEEGCGTPEDFVEVEEVYTWSCTDNDTARTGSGSLTITDEYSEFTSLEAYYETNGCFANLCETLNQNLASQVECNNSPCNNNPQLIDSENFITDEIGLRITDLYSGGSLGEYVQNSNDEYYNNVPEVGVATGNVLTYPSGTFQERFASRTSPPIVFFSGMPEFWYNPEAIMLIQHPSQLSGSQGFIAPHIKNSGVIKHISKVYDGKTVYYKPEKLQVGTEQPRSWHKSDITKEVVLRVLMNSKFESPLPSEYINYNDLRIIVQVNDNGFPTSGGVTNTAQFNNNSIIWTGILSDYADKNIVLRPTDVVENGVELVVMGAGGAVEGTFMSTKPHVHRQVRISLQFGNIEIDGETLQLSPRATFLPYFEEPKRIGQLIEWDDIVIGTTVNYKDICTTLEPVVKACEAVPWQKGGFSYWESGLQYPDNPELYDSSKLKIDVNDVPQQYRTEFQQLFTDGVSAGQYQIKDSFNLTCKPIRHFKFPDNKVVPFIQNTTLTPFSETYIYPLGVTIDENIINMFLDIAVKNSLLTQEERDEIYSYELFRGDLSTNRSVVASGLLYDTRQYTEKEKTVEYLNYPYNSYSADHLNPDSKIKDGFGQRGSNFGFHSPETDYYSPTIPTELNIQGYQFGFSKGYFDEVEGHPKMVILSPEAYSLAKTLATLEVTAEALLTMTQAMANVDAGWQIIQGGIGSTGGGTNWGGYAIQMGIAGSIGLIMAIEGVVYNYGRYKLQWQETFKNLGQQRNFAHYYFSEGNYNYLKTDQTEGHIVRGIHFGKKIKDSRYNITDTVDRDKVELNNIDREYTTFLKLGDNYAINYPSSYSGYDRESITFSSNEGESNEGKSDQIQKRIASPYAQLVNNNPTLHGQIDSITWLYTGYRGDLEYPQSGCLPIFGGDTYISRHTFKRKIPLFLTTAMGQSNMTPFDYKVTNNIGKTPRFYVSYDATSEFRQSGKLFPEVVSDYQFDNQTQRGKYIVPPSKFYLYYYGVPSFLTETRINTHYREFGREPGDNFYPNVGDLGWWTQERNVSIRTPNYYKYSKTYSNQVNVFNHRSLRQTYKQNHQNILDRSVNGVIFSLPDNNENGQIDPWLKFRPLDTFEFETKYGELKELKGIENESILARFEHTAIIYNKVQTTVDDGTSPTVRLGGKDIFQRRTASFVNSELGFGGTQQAESLSCEYGHFYTDTKRGQVIQIPSGGGNMVEISNNNSRGEMTFMRDWFKRNLPFKILNSNINGIQELDVDNNYNGVGISLGYDSQHRRILITKKDYLPLDPCIGYSRELGFYTTCGANVEYSCPPGYTFNSENFTCEREVISDVCPPGYQYDSVNNVCFRNCDIRLAFILDNTGSITLNSAIDYVKAILSSLNYDAQVSFYNLYGSSLTIIEDLNVQQALNFLGNYVGQTSSDYKFAEVTCIAGAWLNQDESVERVMNFYNMDTTEPDPNDYVCGDSQTTGIYSMSDYYKSTGVTIIGTGDYQGTGDVLDFFTEDMFFISSTISQGVIDFYQTLSCEGGSEVPTICDCEIEEDQCVCIQTVPPIVSDTEKVFVCDETKFKDVGWTVSYDPSSGMFHSFMDYKPNFYTSMQGYFEAGKNCLGASTWSHGITNRSYGVFFGNKFPMEVETITKGSLREYIGNVELLTEAKRYQSELDFTINPDITFNKSVIYNRRECSGQMVLDLVKGSLTQYPITTTDHQRIPITKTESTFNYNYFFDRVDRTNVTPFIVNDENQIKVTLDNINFRQRAPLPRINGDWFYNRLTYDTDTKLNLTLKLQKSLTNLDKL